MQGKEYLGLSHISGPIIIVEGVKGVGFDEMVEITDPDGNTRIGRVLEITEDLAVIQAFGGTRGLSIESTRVRFAGRSLELEVSRDMIGRIFNLFDRICHCSPTVPCFLVLGSETDSNADTIR